MERPGHDRISKAVVDYLNRRYYTDSEEIKSLDIPANASDKQMAVFATVEKDASRLNSIIFSCVTNDVVQMDDQFSKLKAWLSEMTDTECRIELSAFLFPLFCHLYIDSLRNGINDASVSMFKKHEEFFCSFEKYHSLIEALKELTSIQDVDSNPFVNTFRSCKYEVKLSPKSLNTLRKYLATHSHVILLQVLQMWFDIETIPDKTLRPESEEEMPHALNAESIVKQDQKNEFVKSTTEDKEIADLLETIKMFNSGPIVPQPMLLYSINNADELLNCATVSNSVNLMAIGCSDSSIRLWNLNQTNFSSRTPLSLSKTMLNCDSRYSDKNSLEEDNINPKNDDSSSASSDGSFRSLIGHSAAVTNLAFVPNADILLSTSWDHTMLAWKTSDFSCTTKYVGHNYPIWGLDVSPLGLHAATGSYDTTARLWSLDRTFPIRIFAGHTQHVNCAKFHPNGSYLATGSSDKSIRLWSVTDGSLVRVFGAGSEVRTIAFSPNGQYIASGGDGKRVHVWNLSTGSILCTMEAHFDIVSTLHWSLDGEILAVGSLDGNVTLWHVKSCESSMEHVATYDTNCQAIISLQYTLKNTLVCIGAYLPSRRVT